MKRKEKNRLKTKERIRLQREYEENLVMHNNNCKFIMFERPTVDFIYRILPDYDKKNDQLIFFISTFIFQLSLLFDYNDDGEVKGFITRFSKKSFRDSLKTVMLIGEVDDTLKEKFITDVMEKMEKDGAITFCTDEELEKKSEEVSE